MACRTSLVQYMFEVLQWSKLFGHAVSSNSRVIRKKKALYAMSNILRIRGDTHMTPTLIESGGR